MAQTPITREGLVDEAIALARKLKSPEQQAQSLLQQVHRLPTADAQLSLIGEARKIAAKATDAAVRRRVESDAARQEAGVRIQVVARARQTGAPDEVVQDVAREAKTAVDAIAEESQRIGLLGSLADALA